MLLPRVSRRPGPESAYNPIHAHHLKLLWEYLRDENLCWTEINVARLAAFIPWLHRDDPNRPVAEIVTTLNEQVKAGTIRYFGCSNCRLERIKEAQEYSALHGMQGFVGNQLMWSLAVPNPAAFSDPTMVWMDSEMKAYETTS